MRISSDVVWGWSNEDADPWSNKIWIKDVLWAYLSFYQDTTVTYLSAMALSYCVAYITGNFYW